MPLTNISNIRFKIFGINLLGMDESQEVRKYWNETFSSRTALMIDDQSDKDVSDLAEGLVNMLGHDSFTVNPNDTIILAYFLDLTKEMPADRIKKLAKLPQVLRAVLQCNISLALQFGYVGRLGLRSKAVETKNIKAVVEQNDQTARDRQQLCLVASPIQKSKAGLNWKAVTVFLDLLRRQTNPSDLIPVTADGMANNDVGFLAYTEHSPSARKKLEDRRTKLKALCENEGFDELKQAVAEKLAIFGRSVQDTYHIAANVFPLHPQMVVDSKWCGMHRKKAAKGTYAPYNNARTAVANALMLTAEDIRKSVQQVTDRQLENIDSQLNSMIEDNSVGIGALEDEKGILSALNVSVDTVSEPTLPNLNYSDSGCSQEIQSYLQDVLNSAIYKGKAAYVAALKTAFERLHEIGFAEKRNAYEDEANEIQTVLSNMPTATDLYTDTLNGTVRLHADFNPSRADGVSNCYAIVRSPEMIELANGINVLVPRATSFYLDERTCGIPVLDDAPMKVLKVVFKDCDEANLRDLIPNVEV